jgi:hypothetical protein
MATRGTRSNTKTVKTGAARRRSSRKPKELVSFDYEGEQYVLDLNRDRVYRNWMAVETNKGVAIIGAYKAQMAASA